MVSMVVLVVVASPPLRLQVVGFAKKSATITHGNQAERPGDIGLI